MARVMPALQLLSFASFFTKRLKNILMSLVPISFIVSVKIEPLREIEEWNYLTLLF